MALELAGLALDAGGRLGSDHPAVMAALQEHAYETAQLGRLTEAESMYRQLLETRLRVLGRHHPATLLTRYGLARSHAYQGRLAEAEEELRDIQTRWPHAESRPRWSGAQGRWAEAESRYRDIQVREP